MARKPTTFVKRETLIKANAELLIGSVEKKAPNNPNKQNMAKADISTAIASLTKIPNLCLMDLPIPIASFVVVMEPTIEPIPPKTLIIAGYMAINPGNPSILLRNPVSTDPLKLPKRLETKTLETPSNMVFLNEGSPMCFLKNHKTRDAESREKTANRDNRPLPMILTATKKIEATIMSFIVETAGYMTMSGFNPFLKLKIPTETVMGRATVTEVKQTKVGRNR